jgi:hypothetical protein
MAEFDSTYINLVSREKIIPVGRKNLYNKSPFYARLADKGKVLPFEGSYIGARPVLRKHKSLGRALPYDSFPQVPINPVVEARMYPAKYFATMQISNSEIRYNSGNQVQILNALKTQFENALESLQEYHYTDIYLAGTAIGGKIGITGMRAIGDTDNTYAYINRSTTGNETWQANQYATAYTRNDLMDNTSVYYFPSLLRTAASACTHKHSPTEIYTTDYIFNMYQDIFDGKLVGDSSMANLGFEAVKFGNMMMTPDKFCPANYLYMANFAEDFELRVYDGANFDLGGKGWTDMNPIQDVQAADVIWEGNLFCNSPWHVAEFSSVAAS